MRVPRQHWMLSLRPGAARDGMLCGWIWQFFRRRKNHMKSLNWGGVAMAAAALLVCAQNTGLQRTVVDREDVSVPGREAVIARIELAPGAFAGRHTHPGDEISYVV